jgi:hypothetical protein
LHLAETPIRPIRVTDELSGLKRGHVHAERLPSVQAMAWFCCKKNSMLDRGANLRVIAP